MRIHNRRWPAALAGLSMLLTLPVESHAGLCDWFKCKSCQTAAAPALACNPCAQAQTVSYVPQTSYRCQSVTVPVTSYQPVVSADPCTGCQVTSYRPVTGFVQQTRMVPYMSYRLVYSNRPCVTCAPVAATTTYIPSTTYVPQAVQPAAYAAPAACPTCPGGSPSYGAATGAPSLLTAPAYGGQPYGAPNYGAPGYGAPPAGGPTYSSPSAIPTAPSNYAPPSYSQPGAQSTFAPPPPRGAAAPNSAGAYGAAGSTTSGYAAAPYYNPGYAGSNPNYSGSAPAAGSSQPASPSNPPSSTFQSNPPQNQAAPGGRLPLKPIPDQNMTPGSKVNSSSNLRLLDPDNRTTSAPAYPAWGYTPVAWASAATQTSNIEEMSSQQPAAAAPVADDADGWRPSNR